jgi:chromosome segregation ATPase
MANRIVRSIRAIRDIKKQPLFTNEQNDLLSDTNDDVYVRLARRYERITGLPKLENKFRMHLMDYNQFKDDTQNMLIFLNNENERQDMMIDKINTDVDELYKKAKRLKEISDEHTEKLVSLTNDLINVKNDVENNRGLIITTSDNLNALLKRIEQEDKQDKLQSEIDEVKKTVEAIQSDLEESQTLENMKQLKENIANFYSVSSNVTENVANKKDHVYFDIYSIMPMDDINISISEKEMDKDGKLGKTHYLAQTDDYTIDKVNNNYTSIGVNTSKYEHIHIFTLKINNIPYHSLQVKFSDY